MKLLSEELIKEFLIEKLMNPGKSKWYFRCQECQNVFNNEDHGHYVLVDTFGLDFSFQFSMSDVHEGTLFCSIACAEQKIRKAM